MGGGDVADIAGYRRVVLKIGSSLLVDDTYRLREDWLRAFCGDIGALTAGGCEVVVVSSGAIALGRGELGFGPGRRRLNELQAAAAVGQIRLADAWHNALAERGLVAAQVLLTSEDTEHRRRYLNAYDTLSTLLASGAVPVVNENDTVATDEIRYGDNDRLAARVAQMIGAGALVLFSSVDGLYTDLPDRPGARHVPEVRTLSGEVAAMAKRETTQHGTGGMAAKLAAARIAVAAGCDLFVADGRGPHPLRALAEGARCTRFVASGSPLQARKRWIGAALRVGGVLTLDDGAVEALGRGRSLLPVGVTAVTGDFRRGDTVALRDARGDEIARGLIAYDSDEARRIIGRSSAEIEAVLGYPGRPAIVHRDDLAFVAPRGDAGGEPPVSDDPTREERTG